MSGYERYTYNGYQENNGDMPRFRKNETTRLVIEDDTIYEIDLQCEECLKRAEFEKNKGKN